MVAPPRFAWIVTEVDRQWPVLVLLPIALAMTDIFPMPGCRVEAITLDGPDLLHVDARGTRPGGCCPA